MMNRTAAIFLLLTLSATAWGQENEEHLFQTDTLQVIKKMQIIGLPLLFYTPETSFGGGVGMQMFFNNQRSLYNNRVSNLFTTAIYTTNKQLIVNRIPPALNFGFEYQYENHVMLEVTEGGLLDTAGIPGSEGARTSGLSFVLDVDSRDNIYSTLGGAFLTFKGGFSAKTFGASYAYNKYLIDLRKYFVIGGKHTLATQAYFQSVAGDVPFQSMSWLGGADRNRGYFKGRYIDRVYMLVQAEMRWRVWSRLHINGFAALGQVSDRDSEPSNQIPP